MFFGFRQVRIFVEKGESLNTERSSFMRLCDIRCFQSTSLIPKLLYTLLYDTQSDSSRKLTKLCLFTVKKIHLLIFVTSVQLCKSIKGLSIYIIFTRPLPLALQRYSIAFSGNQIFLALLYGRMIWNRGRKTDFTPSCTVPRRHPEPMAVKRILCRPSGRGPDGCCTSQI